MAGDETTRELRSQRKVSVSKSDRAPSKTRESRSVSSGMSAVTDGRKTPSDVTSATGKYASASKCVSASASASAKAGPKSECVVVLSAVPLEVKSASVSASEYAEAVTGAKCNKQSVVSDERATADETDTQKLFKLLDTIAGAALKVRDSRVTVTRGDQAQISKCLEEIRGIVASWDGPTEATAKAVPQPVVKRARDATTQTAAPVVQSTTPATAEASTATASTSAQTPVETGKAKKKKKRKRKKKRKQVSTTNSSALNVSAAAASAAVAGPAAAAAPATAASPAATPSAAAARGGDWTTVTSKKTQRQLEADAKRKQKAREQTRRFVESGKFPVLIVSGDGRTSEEIIRGISKIPLGSVNQVKWSLRLLTLHSGMPYALKYQKFWALALKTPHLQLMGSLTASRTKR